MAAFAAARIFAGVSKLGSPALRPIMSLPAALRARARSVAARVGDGLMRDKRSARKAMTRSGWRKGRRKITANRPGPPYRSAINLPAGHIPGPKRPGRHQVGARAVRREAKRAEARARHLRANY